MPFPSSIYAKLRVQAADCDTLRAAIERRLRAKHAHIDDGSNTTIDFRAGISRGWVRDRSLGGITRGTVTITEATVDTVEVAYCLSTRDLVIITSFVSATVGLAAGGLSGSIAVAALAGATYWVVVTGANYVLTRYFFGVIIRRCIAESVRS